MQKSKQKKIREKSEYKCLQLSMEKWEHCHLMRFFGAKRLMIASNKIDIVLN